MRSMLAAVVVAVVLVACAQPATLPVSAGTGPNPVLPPPTHSLIPAVDIAPARGWPEGGTPSAGEGLTVNAFAIGLDHPRWLYVLPNGDVLVAETNAPKRPDDATGIRGFIYRLVQKRAGAGGPSANRITLLRDSDGDGSADVRTAFIEDLNSPFGIALVGNDLYVADTDALLRFSYTPGATRITARGTKVAALPAGTINHHWTKNVIASPDGSRLFVAIGSNSNVAENGIEAERERAAVWEVDPKTGAHRVFALGLRNPVGMAWEPETGALWVAVNERDELGGDLVPDYMTAVRDGAFYGWPYSYYGQHVDDRVAPQNPELVARAVVPDYALGPHTASLGLCAAEGQKLGARFEHGMFIGQHGSWNRVPRSGYRVIFVPFDKGKPAGAPAAILTGFVSDNGDAFGRPVGVAIDRRGGLLVADDVGNAVWRVSGTEGDEKLGSR
jgi:glucose/arabinose dehydrogenase